MAHVEEREVTGWVGWIYFASMMMLILGGLQAINGLVAIFRHGYYVSSPNSLVVWNYTSWGWIHLILGVLAFVTGLALMSGRTWARVLTSIVVIFAAIDNIVFLPAFPVWSIIALIINALVLYAVTVHGREVREEY
jgi:hypothetical protein